MMDSTHDVQHALDQQAKSIDTLHDKLAAVPGIKKEQLKSAIERYKTAHQAFTNDALECMH